MLMLDFVTTCIATDSHMHHNFALACFTLGLLPPLIMLSVLLQNNVISSAISNVVIAVNCLTRIQQVQSIVSCTHLTRWLEIDHIYHDITLEEEYDNKGHLLASTSKYLIQHMIQYHRNSCLKDLMRSPIDDVMW